jgi:hypothetical protein
VTLSSDGCPTRRAGDCSVDRASVALPSPEWLVGFGESFTKVLWNAANFHAPPQSVARRSRALRACPPLDRRARSASRIREPRRHLTRASAIEPSLSCVKK